MIDVSKIDYTTEGMFQTKHYRIVIADSRELQAPCYWAQNKLTNVLEVPFRYYGDGEAVLTDLELAMSNQPGSGEGSSVVSITH